jgi:hypothetical protein
MNGVPVTQQVVKYQKTHDNRDYLPIQLYYERYKDKWYNKIKDHIDRVSFDSDYDYRLVKAVDSFSMSKAKLIADKKGYGSLAAFNGWFYSCLSNWSNNIITSSYRMKKRPSVSCPICGRMVTNITEDHLKHYKTIGDLPKFVTWKNKIYEVCPIPKNVITCWGDYAITKMRNLNKGISKPYLNDKHKVLWPWHDSNGDPRVICPFTRKMVKQIDDEYIQSLPNEYNRYSEHIEWSSFIEKYPGTLLHADIYSLDHLSSSNDISLADYVSTDLRVDQGNSYMDWQMIRNGVSNTKYDHVFKIIDRYVDESDRDIFKLLAIGYTVDDIADTLNIDKKSIKDSMKTAKSLDEMKQMLIESCCII